MLTELKEILFHTYTEVISKKDVYTDYDKRLMNYKVLIEYKKQIILQGPPGTGKTRLAKTLADQLTNNPKLDRAFVTENLQVGQVIKGNNDTSYTIKEVKYSNIIVTNEDGENHSVNINHLIDRIEKGDFIENTGNFIIHAALAKYLIAKLASGGEQKIVQFHPSYTYEDFVRGIVAEPNGNSVTYTNTNKTLADFAEKALKNYKASTQDYTDSNLDSWINESFESFKEEIAAKLPEEETPLSGDISIFEVSKRSFRYGKTWKNASHINFDEFKKLIKAVVKKELQLSNKQMDKERFIHAHYRYTYYNALLELFFKEYQFTGKFEKVRLKNYVLIIDEINRANLSSVLGELIYALEYREEAVSSMYAVDESINKDKNAIILPPNLYIIGTMNTADRSVGHIDYAVRRRFAFVDVLPKDLSDDNAINFNSELFLQVKKLFTTDDYKTSSEYLAGEFEPKDVALGHSYFIDKTEEGGSMDIRLEYEIKPILLEYVKDGILKESAREVIEGL